MQRASFPSLSLIMDPRVSLVDAFSAAWTKQKIQYAFPPSAILPQVVEKMKQKSGAPVFLIAPFVPAAPWFLQVQRWSVTDPLVLQVSPNPLRQPHCMCQHPQPEAMRLHLFQVKISS